MKKGKKLLLCMLMVLAMTSLTGCSISFDEEAFEEWLIESRDKIIEEIKKRVNEYVEDTTDSLKGDIVISYNANGGVFNDDELSNVQVYEKILGMTRMLSKKVPVLDGYHFMGWSTEYNEETGEVGNPKYQPGEMFVNFSDKQLYAVWMNHNDFLTCLIENTDEDKTFGPASLRKNHKVVKAADAVIVCSCGGQINDPDSNGDGISDYCTWSAVHRPLIKGDVTPFAQAINMELYEENLDWTPSEARYHTIQAYGDIDNDGKKNGEEVKITLFEDYRVGVEMITDPLWREPASYIKVDEGDYNYLLDDHYTALLFLDTYTVSSLENAWEQFKFLFVKDKDIIAKQQIAESLMGYVEVITKKELSNYKIEFIKYVTAGVAENTVNILKEAIDVGGEVGGDVAKAAYTDALTEYVKELYALSDKVNELQINIEDDFTYEKFNEIDKLGDAIQDISAKSMEKMTSLKQKGIISEELYNNFLNCHNIKIKTKNIEVVKGAIKGVGTFTFALDVWKTFEDWHNASTLYAQLNASVDSYMETGVVLDKLQKSKVDYVKNAAKSLDAEWTEATIDAAEVASAVWMNFQDEIVDAVVIKACAGISPYLLAARLGETIGKGITNKSALEKAIVRTITAAETAEICEVELVKRHIDTGNNSTYLKENAEGFLRLLTYLRVKGEDEALNANNEDKKNLFDQLAGMDNTVIEDNTKSYIEKLNTIAQKYFSEYDLIPKELLGDENAVKELENK